MIAAQVTDEIEVATGIALASPQPAADTLYRYVYSPDVDPTAEQFDTEDDPQFGGEPTTMVDLLNGLPARRDAARSRASWCSARTWPTCRASDYLGDVKGKGGVFKVTWGLQKQFGGTRVFNSPLAEANIVGRAIGLATRGMKPVVEIQFFDYIWPAYMQLRNELALMRWRIEQRQRVAGRGAGDLRRLPQGRRGVSLADRGGGVHRGARGCGWSVRRRRSTPTACCARRSAARIR